MLYAILCYNREALVEAWPADKDAAVMAGHQAVLQRLAGDGRLGPSARLMATTTAVTVRHGAAPLVLDGPFAETKEQLLGFFVIECAGLEQAIEAARNLLVEGGAMEIRPIVEFEPGNGMT